MRLRRQLVATIAAGTCALGAGGVVFASQASTHPSGAAAVTRGSSTHLSSDDGAPLLFTLTPGAAQTPGAEDHPESPDATETPEPADMNDEGKGPDADGDRASNDGRDDGNDHRGGDGDSGGGN